MTKIEAIIKVLRANNGKATLDDIYAQITMYYPNAKRSETWQEGIRGVLYRDMRKNNRIERIDEATYMLKKERP